jgi:hypothetical protein
MFWEYSYVANSFFGFLSRFSLVLSLKTGIRAATTEVRIVKQPTQGTKEVGSAGLLGAQAGWLRSQLNVRLVCYDAAEIKQI